MLIEFWKITKVMNVTIDTTPGQVPRLKFENRSSYVDSSTKKWDEQATRWMLILLIPCVICYFVYSLMYEKHKNWCALSHTVVASLSFCSTWPRAVKAVVNDLPIIPFVAACDLGCPSLMHDSPADRVFLDPSLRTSS
jgi:hypothetical protein